LESEKSSANTEAIRDAQRDDPAEATGNYDIDKFVTGWFFGKRYQ